MRLWPFITQPGRQGCLVSAGDFWLPSASAPLSSSSTFPGCRLADRLLAQPHCFLLHTYMQIYIKTQTHTYMLTQTQKDTDKNIHADTNTNTKTQRQQRTHSRNTHVLALGVMFSRLARILAQPHSFLVNTQAHTALDINAERQS